MISYHEYDSDDCAVAMAAAQSMATRFQQDVVILADLSVRLLRDCDEPPLEIIRYQEPARKGFRYE